MRIHQDPPPRHGRGASPSDARPVHGIRREVKDPVRCSLVLPRARLEQVAHDRDPPGAAHALGRLQGVREAEDAMPAGDQNLDQR